jgi:hypothetical protein
MTLVHLTRYDTVQGVLTEASARPPLLVLAEIFTDSKRARTYILLAMTATSYARARCLGRPAFSGAAIATNRKCSRRCLTEDGHRDLSGRNVG